MSANNDKRIQSIDSVERYAYETNEEKIHRKEEIKCNNIIRGVACGGVCVCVGGVLHPPQLRLSRYAPEYNKTKQKMIDYVNVNVTKESINKDMNK